MADGDHLDRVRSSSSTSGTTLDEIAGEKAGIIKPGVPVVVGDVATRSGDGHRAIAPRARAPLVRAMDGVDVGHDAHRRRRPAIRLRTPGATTARCTLALAGDHQVDNAVVAVRCSSSSTTRA